MKFHRLLPALCLSCSFSATADTLFTSDFDVNTGAFIFAGNADNTNGAATLVITDWTTDASVSLISDLTAISTGDSGTTGGFAQTQNGAGTYANPNVAYLSRNHNQDADRSTSQRGYSLTFTLTASRNLDTLTIHSGHTNDSGNSDQAFSSDLTYSLSGGSLGAPVTATINENYGTAPAFHAVAFDLTGNSIDAGTYTVEVYQSSMPGGGAYAVYDGITLEGHIPPPDVDGDGLSDLYEQTIIDFDGGDAVDGLEDVMGTGGAPAVTDFDGDGSDDAMEFTNGTSPTNPDTDSDGFHDGAETLSGIFVSYNYGTNTGDTGTDPLDDDSDNDELLDGVESGTGVFVSASDTGSDPNTDDTDLDTLLDGWEVTYDLDPTDNTAPNGELDDPDLDTLQNWEEQIEGTDPKLADTDLDGVNDDIELFVDGTDPLNPDTDGDSLSDGDEVIAGTDPLLADSDGDGFSDGAEVAAASDPLLATSVPAYAVFTSNFDANTGATILAGNTDNTSGAATLGVTWIQHASVTSVSDLTAISTGDSGTLGGFAQLQGGTAAFADADNVYLSRNHNLDTDRTTSQRGYSVTFTTNAPVNLGILTVISGHTNNQGTQNQAFASDLTYSLSGGTLGSPVTGTLRPDYTGIAYIPVAFDLSGTTLGAGVYTLNIHQSDMVDGGAYAMYNGISLTDSTDPATSPPVIALKVISAGFNGAAFDLEVSGLDIGKSYLLLHSENLQDNFPTQIGLPITPTLSTETFSDPAPSGTEGFYRVQEAP